MHGLLWFIAGAVLGAVAVTSSSSSSSSKLAWGGKNNNARRFGKKNAGAGGAAVPRPRGEYKLLLIVRKDLKMGGGKVAAQCCHATLGAVERCDASVVEYWRGQGEAKVVVKCESEVDMMKLRQDAMRRDVPTHVVCDAGRTQIAAGSRTVLALGPARREEIDAVAGHLKLL